MKAEAITLASEGYAIFPLFKSRKLSDGTLLCTCGKTGCDGKHPMVKFSEWSTTDKQKISDFWNRRPHANIGIHLGKSHQFVLDVDGDDGIESLQKLEEKYGELPETRVVSTGRGFHHYFTAWTVKIPSFNTGEIGKGLDVKGNDKNAFVVSPPSIHHSGTRYDYVSRIPAVDAPDWLINLILSSRKTVSLPAGSDLTIKDIEAVLNNRKTFEIPLWKLLTKEELNKLTKDGDNLVGQHPIHGSPSDPREFTISLKHNRWRCWWCESGGGLFELAALLSGLCRCDEFKKDNIIKPLSGSKFTKAVQVCLNRGIDAISLKKHISKGGWSYDN